MNKIKGETGDAPLLPASSSGGKVEEKKINKSDNKTGAKALHVGVDASLKAQQSSPSPHCGSYRTP